VVHDVSSASSDVILPVGFVFGTGSNAAMRDVNTQASSVNLFEKDKVYQEMVDQGFVPAKPQMKLWMGGERIAYRVAAGMHLLAKEGLVREDTANAVAKMIKENGKGLIVSNIMNGELSYDALIQAGIPITFSEYNLLKRSSEASLTQAGQAIGVMLATTIEAAGHTSGTAKVPVEGSVFWKAHGVREIAQETVKLLLPEVEVVPYEASGLQGIGKLALTYSHEKKKTGDEIVFQQ
jgi:hexokinase